MLGSWWPGYVSSDSHWAVVSCCAHAYHQRIRLEGCDIEWMMSAAGVNTPVAELSQVAAAEPAPSKETQG